MQTLVDMAERHSSGESHRLLVAAEGVVEGFSVAGWLEREGFDVITASDGQEALQIACSSWQPDVVLLDLELPGVDGFSVYKQIRAKNRRAVIFVLGDGSEVDEVRSLEAGADDYAAKRFSPEVLLARVRTHLRSRRAAGNQRILQPGDLWLDAKNYATRVKGEWVDLRPQEFRLLNSLGSVLGGARKSSRVDPACRSDVARRLQPHGGYTHQPYPGPHRAPFGLHLHSRCQRLWLPIRARAKGAAGRGRIGGELGAGPSIDCLETFSEVQSSSTTSKNRAAVQENRSEPCPKPVVGS